MNEKNSFQKHTLQKHTMKKIGKSNTLNKSFFFKNFLGRVAVCKPWLIFADGNRSGGTCQKKKEIK